MEPTPDMDPVAAIKSRIDNPELLVQRREQLVAVATRLFEQQGFGATTLDDIAEQVGVTVGAVYRYIGRKEDLLILILDDLLRRYETTIAAALEGCDDPLSRLRSAMSGYYRVIDEEGYKVLLAYRESKHLTEPQREWLKNRELETNRIFERILEEGIRDGVFEPVDPSLVAYNIIMLGHAWALKYWFFRDRMGIEDYVRVQAQWLLPRLLRKGASAN